MHNSACVPSNMIPIHIIKSFTKIVIVLIVNTK